MSLDSHQPEKLFFVGLDLKEDSLSGFLCDKLQVKVLPDGTMEGSSTADIKRLKTDLYSDVADDAPIPLPDRLNIYRKDRSVLQIIN